jgi:hypothetical protein
MDEFLVIAFGIGEFVAYMLGLSIWIFKDNILTGIICFCLAIYFNLCKNEYKHKLEKQGKL